MPYNISESMIKAINKRIKELGFDLNTDVATLLNFSKDPKKLPRINGKSEFWEEAQRLDKVDPMIDCHGYSAQALDIYLFRYKALEWIVRQRKDGLLRVKKLLTSKKKLSTIYDERNSHRLGLFTCLYDALFAVPSNQVISRNGVGFFSPQQDEERSEEEKLLVGILQEMSFVYIKENIDMLKKILPVRNKVLMKTFFKNFLDNIEDQLEYQDKLIGLDRKITVPGEIEHTYTAINNYNEFKKSPEGKYKWIQSEKMGNYLKSAERRLFNIIKYLNVELLLKRHNKIQDSFDKKLKECIQETINLYCTIMNDLMEIDKDTTVTYYWPKFLTLPFRLTSAIIDDAREELIDIFLPIYEKCFKEQTQKINSESPSENQNTQELSSESGYLRLIYEKLASLQDYTEEDIIKIKGEFMAFFRMKILQHHPDKSNDPRSNAIACALNNQKELFDKLFDEKMEKLNSQPMNSFSR